MTRLMVQAIAQASRLPEEAQDEIASIILREIESEGRWDELFTQPGSADPLSSMADEALVEVRSGWARPLDLDEL